jgi:KDO2-lipid IV(A) lauroyltransferase
MEEFVRAYPEQWLWIHKRWNTRPAGEPSLY